MAIMESPSQLNLADPANPQKSQFPRVSSRNELGGQLLSRNKTMIRGYFSLLLFVIVYYSFIFIPQSLSLSLLLYFIFGLNP